MKMSILNLPSIRHHWGVLGTSSIYNIMTVNRFEEIKRFIHFNETPQVHQILMTNYLINKLEIF